MISETSAGDAPMLEWVKSSYSDSSNSNECVEVATAPDAVHVRDSKNLQGPRLTVARAAWEAFVPHVDEGR
ncbi:MULTISPECIES: DUF397 domain-containing protein [unclassified Streptomyces]|uniref:DUF397 domain-containing protein n=1 Tax=unclassified Streptomyces TaxID=2593676 RepID=UPI001B367F36|nr:MULTISPECIES: DUF397 domain-containing protein [unclassified Streptomyces]MBQ1108709.1 DUF397 domain-containing protein [Streptomyces sp. 404i]MBQ1113851.1 DUF397 domain-containing protein [Streptomyces sp. C3-3]MDQ0698078.1 hypothetical protein [Streptomyces sp. W4I9-2]